MSNDVVQITDETKNKLKELNKTDFDEQEAYFLLCEIFAHAQATKDYAKFQTDLNEWKKRFPIELFSENYKAKIKYMLSKEFLDTVLKNFIAFDELSKKDPSIGLEKLRKTLNKAEKHKDSKQLDKDLDILYKEYPLSFLKEKYPHLVAQLLSKSNRTRILEKFDSGLAFKELTNITEHPDKFDNVDDFKSTLDEWKKLYPTEDFNDKYKSQVEKMLTETLDSRNLEELFPVSTELDLSLGEVIPLELKDTVKNLSLISKDALHDFFKIVDKNKGDIDSLFNWVCKYNRYINSFDSSIKTAIVENLMTKYAYELPPVGTKFQIPKMDAGSMDLLSLSDFQNMEDTKKQVVLQLLGILATGRELTHEDNYRLEIIGTNAKKLEIIEKAKIEPKLDLFMEKFPEDKLTPSDIIYIEPEATSNTRVDITIDNEEQFTAHTDEAENLIIENEEDSFKETIKVTDPIEKVDTSSSNNSTTDSGGTSGGFGNSISRNEANEIDAVIEDVNDDKKEVEEEKINTPEKPVIEAVESEPPFSTIKAVILDSEPVAQDLETEETPVIEDTLENSSETTSVIENVVSVEETETKVEENFQETEEVKAHNPVQNFFKRFLGRERNNVTRDDDRDER